MTHDLVVGCIFDLEDPVFGGSFRNPKHLYDRRLRVRIIRDSYGDVKGQHTFTLEVLEADRDLQPGDTIRRKGRNVYGRIVGDVEYPPDYAEKAADKHARGAEAAARRLESLRSEVASKPWLADKIEFLEVKLNASG